MMIFRSFSLALILTLLAPGAFGGGPPSLGLSDAVGPAESVEHKRIAPSVVEALRLDYERSLESDAEPGPRPLRFALSVPVDYDLDDDGTWQTLEDGSSLWRLRIDSPGAVNLNVGLRRFLVPEGAQLWVHTPSGEVQGPYGPRQATPDHQLWLPISSGDELMLELHVPAGAPTRPELVIAAVNHGFRDIDDSEPLAPQGNCDIDVVCPEGDAWRDQIRSVARYTIGGTFVCTATLVNNSAQDFTPYMLTAYHCNVTPDTASTLVFYWNYEASTCGVNSGGSLAQNQSGAIYRASHGSSDFALVELLQRPDPAFNVYYAGLKASGLIPGFAVGIHHPGGTVKAISIDTDPPLLVNTPTSLGVPVVANSHLRTTWDAGTTAGGSSGSCLFDPADGFCIGHISTGTGGCAAPTTDYSRLSFSWNGGGAFGSRLVDWLDPTGSGSLVISGSDPIFGPLGHWKFDDAQGSIADDEIANNDGSVIDAPWTAGVSGTALEFNGTSSFVQIPHVPAYSVNDALTIEAWIRMSPVQVATQPTLVDKGHAEGPDDFTGFSIEDAPSLNALRFRTGDGSNWYMADSGSALADGGWHHVAATMSQAAGLVRFYVDGQKTGEEPFSGPHATNTRDLFVGRWWQNQTRNFTGTIDEVRLWDDALSGTAILAQYRRFITFCPGEVTELDLVHDGGSGNTVLAFSPPLPAPPAESLYDALRATSPSGFNSATCVGTNSPTPQFNDGQTPPTGQIYYYLVRAKTSLCGNSSLGKQSNGTPRSGTNCP